MQEADTSMRVSIKHLILMTATVAAAACQDYDRTVTAPSGDYAAEQTQNGADGDRHEGRREERAVLDDSHFAHAAGGRSALGDEEPTVWGERHRRRFTEPAGNS